MSGKRSTPIALLLAVAAFMAACQDPSGTPAQPTAANDASQNKPAAAVDGGPQLSPGKPTAPVSIEYSIIGAAVVGQPVSVNLQVSSTQPGLPVTLEYRSSDTTAMLFPESQARSMALAAAEDSAPRLQQVTVIPQREGRLYLNVSAAVETENGTLFRSVAVPIQVGAGNGEPAVNGEIQVTPEGETVISLPASESEGN